MAKNPFDQFDNDSDAAPARPATRAPSASADPRLARPDTQGQIRILMQEYQTIMAQPPGPRRDGDIASVARELRNLGVSVDAPQSTAAAPMVPRAPGAPATPFVVDASGRIGPAPVAAPVAAPAPVVEAAPAPRTAPRRGSLRALAQATPGVQMTESPTAQAIETGVTSGATAGLDIYARAMYHRMMTGDSFEKSLAAVRAEQKAIKEKSPVITGVGQAAGNIGLAVLTGGASLPQQIAANAAIAGSQKLTESAESNLSDAAKAAALSGGLTGAGGLVTRAVGKTVTGLSQREIIKELDSIARLPKNKAAEAEERLRALNYLPPKGQQARPNDMVYGQIDRSAGGTPQNFAKEVIDTLTPTKGAPKIVDRAQDPIKSIDQLMQVNRQIKQLSNRGQTDTKKYRNLKGQKAELSQTVKDMKEATATRGEFLKGKLTQNVGEVLRGQAAAGVIGGGGGGLGGLAYEYGTNRDEADFDPYSALTSGAILGGTLLPLKVVGARYAAGHALNSPTVMKAVPAATRGVRYSVPAATGLITADRGDAVPTTVNPFDQFDSDPDN